MAGDWIKMRTSLLKAPQVIRLAGDLNRSKLEILGALFTIWTIADESSLEGNIKLGPKHLDAEMGLPGFAEAMAAVGWLEVLDPNSIRLTNYGEHNGKTGKRRAEDYQRAKDIRAKEKADKKARDLQTLNGQIVDKVWAGCGQIVDELPTDCGQKVTAFGLEKELEEEKEEEKEKESYMEALNENSPAEQAAQLTRMWLFQRRGTCASEQVPKVLEHFSEALRTGMDYDKAVTDMKSRVRRKTEYLWEFMERNHPRVRAGAAVNTSMEATLQRMMDDPAKAKMLEVAYGN